MKTKFDTTLLCLVLLTFLTLGMVFAVPIFSMVAVFFTVPACVYIARRTTVFAPSGIIVAFFLLSLFLNYNIFIFLSYPVMLVLYLAIFFSLRVCKHYIAGFSIAIVSTMSVVVMCFVTVGSINGNLDPSNTISEYISESHNDIVIVTLARVDMARYQAELDESEPLKLLDLSKIRPSTTPSPETMQALQRYAYNVQLELDEFAFEVIFRYAILLSAICFLACYMTIPVAYTVELENEKKYVYYPETIKNYKRVSPSSFRQPISMLALPREYFLFVFIPITGMMWLTSELDFSVIFSVMWGSICIVPFALAGTTLGLYLSDYVETPSISLIIKIVIVSALAIGIYFPMALFALSLFGVADAIISTRRLIENILLD